MSSYQTNQRPIATNANAPAPVCHVSVADLPTRYGSFQIHIFTGHDGEEIAVLVAGTPIDRCLVRVHSGCATGDLFGSQLCDCGDQLAASFEKIAAAGCGIIIYIFGHEGRNIGLGNKIKAYALQEQGFDTVDANLHLGFPADARSYCDAISILKYFNIYEVRLLTNNPAKISALESGDIAVVEHVPLWTETNPRNERYIQTKIERMQHLSKKP
ncbi:MAG: GTP cyclohydrolase II [Alphaproteobacteria bacterium]|nr:GTP cyclohydrolase II [Alphaproteobacteria bacterium]